jgi:hypothetical protein
MPAIQHEKNSSTSQEDFGQCPDLVERGCVADKSQQRPNYKGRL